MKTKNIITNLINVLVLAFLILPTSSVQSAESACKYSFFSGYLLMFNGLTNTILIMFLALFVWLISPVGILFFGSAKILFSPKSSLWKKKIAWILQGISFLIWSSFISVLLIIYLDSVWYNIFNFGGNTLNLLISSGVGFALVMFLMVTFEKKISEEKSEEKNAERYEINGDANDTYKESEKQEYKKEKKSPKNKKKSDTIKIAGIEFSGVKEKIKKRIKEDLKEIIDEEIDKRL